MILSIDFQEGFFGEHLEIRHGNQVLASLSPRTRLQTGLAEHVELSAPAGADLIFALPDSGVSSSFSVPGPAESHRILINRNENGLHIAATEDEPGYL